MTTETNADRLERLKDINDLNHIVALLHPSNDTNYIALERDIDWLIEQAERAQELEQSTTVHVIKRRNGKATIIGWNGDRYVYQSESSARGGVPSGKQHKGQTYKT